MMDTQTLYQKAIRFAALKHAEKGQTIPGTNLSYVVHLSNVAMEILFAFQHSSDFNLNFAVQVALLHDTLEDTATTFQELLEVFDIGIANAVAALTKNDALPKKDKMPDSLSRIKILPKEVAAVKLADRITNLQAPPNHWTDAKKFQYQQEATTILHSLAGANSYLEIRLDKKIKEYTSYISKSAAVV